MTIPGRTRAGWWAASLAIAVLFSSCSNDSDAPAADEPENIGEPTWPDRVPEKLDFVAHVRPILVINCIECHNTKDAAKYKGVNLQTREGAMASGENGPAIIPGKPEESLLIGMLKKDPSHEWAMPPTPDRIWGIRLEILERWIREGAQWPDGVVLEHPAELDKW
jgi:hypothetical protein